jgi:O-antigen ligase
MFTTLRIHRQAGFWEKDRISIWRDAWRIIHGRLIFDEGLGTFQWLFPAYEKMDPNTPARYAHNDYIQALVETGIMEITDFSLYIPGVAV